MDTTLLSSSSSPLEPLLIRSSFSVEETLSTQATVRSHLEKKKRRKWKRKLFFRHHRDHWEEMIRGTFPVFVAAMVNTVVQQLLDLIVGTGGVRLQIVVNFLYASCIAHVLGYVVAYNIPANHPASDYYASLVSDNAAFAWSSFCTLVIMNWVYSDYPLYAAMLTWLFLVLFVLCFVYTTNYLQATWFPTIPSIRRQLRDFESDCFALAIAYSFTVMVAVSCYQDSATDYLSNTDDLDSNHQNSSQDDALEASASPYAWLFFVYTMCSTLALFAYQWQFDRFIQRKMAKRQRELLLLADQQRHQQQRLLQQQQQQQLQMEKVARDPLLTAKNNANHSTSNKTNNSTNNNRNSSSTRTNPVMKQDTASNNSNNNTRSSTGYKFVTTPTPTLTSTSKSMKISLSQSPLHALPSANTSNTRNHAKTANTKYAYNIVSDDDTNSDDDGEDDDSDASDKNDNTFGNEEEEVDDLEADTIEQLQTSYALDHSYSSNESTNYTNNTTTFTTTNNNTGNEDDHNIHRDVFIIEHPDAKNQLIGSKGSCKRRVYRLLLPWDHARHCILSFKRCYYTCVAYIVACNWHVWCALSFTQMLERLGSHTRSNNKSSNCIDHHANNNMDYRDYISHISEESDTRNVFSTLIRNAIAHVARNTTLTGLHTETMNVNNRFQDHHYHTVLVGGNSTNTDNTTTDDTESMSFLYLSLLAAVIFAFSVSLFVALGLTLVSWHKEWVGLRDLSPDTLSSWFNLRKSTTANHVNSTNTTTTTTTNNNHSDNYINAEDNNTYDTNDNTKNTTTTNSNTNTNTNIAMNTTPTHHSNSPPGSDSHPAHASSWYEMEGILYVTFGRLTVGWAWNNVFSNMLALVFTLLVGNHHHNNRSSNVNIWMLLAIRVLLVSVVVYVGYRVDRVFVRRRNQRAAARHNNSHNSNNNDSNNNNNNSDNNFSINNFSINNIHTTNVTTNITNNTNYSSNNASTDNVTYVHHNTTFQVLSSAGNTDTHRGLLAGESKLTSVNTTTNNSNKRNNYFKNNFFKFDNEQDDDAHSNPESGHEDTEMLRERLHSANMRL